MKKALMVLVGMAAFGFAFQANAGSDSHPNTRGYVELPDGRIVAARNVPEKFRYLIAQQLGEGHPSLEGPRKETAAEYFKRNPHHRYHRVIAPLAIAAGAAGLAAVSKPAEASQVRISVDGAPPKPVRLSGTNVGLDLESELEAGAGAPPSNPNKPPVKNVAR